MKSETETLQLDLMAFGSLKDFVLESLVLRVAKGVCADDVLKLVETALSEDSRLSLVDRQRLSRILAETALAQSDRILTKADKIESSCRLALLPPVCGG